MTVQDLINTIARQAVDISELRDAQDRMQAMLAAQAARIEGLQAPGVEEGIEEE